MWNPRYLLTSSQALCLLSGGPSQLSMCTEKCWFLWAPSTLTTLWCSSAAVARCSECVNTNGINTLKKCNPQVRWTQAFCKATINNELTVDNSFEFGKYRNEPVKYQQELWNKTTDAMKTVEKIKCQAKCIMNKLKKNKGLQKVQDIKEIRQNSSWPLLQAKESSWKKRWYSSYNRMQTWQRFLKNLMVYNHFYIYICENLET